MTDPALSINPLWTANADLESLGLIALDELKHRMIDDTSILTTSLWSAAKITAEIAAGGGGTGGGAVTTAANLGALADGKNEGDIGVVATPRSAYVWDDTAWVRIGAGPGALAANYQVTDETALLALPASNIGEVRTVTNSVGGTAYVNAGSGIVRTTPIYIEVANVSSLPAVVSSMGGDVARVLTPNSFYILHATGLTWVLLNTFIVLTNASLPTAGDSPPGTIHVSSTTPRTIHINNGAAWIEISHDGFVTVDAASVLALPAGHTTGDVSTVVAGAAPGSSYVYNGSGWTRIARGIDVTYLTAAGNDESDVQTSIGALVIADMADGDVVIIRGPGAVYPNIIALAMFVRLGAAWVRSTPIFNVANGSVHLDATAKVPVNLVPSHNDLTDWDITEHREMVPYTGDSKELSTATTLWSSLTVADKITAAAGDAAINPERGFAPAILSSISNSTAGSNGALSRGRFVFVAAGTNVVSFDYGNPAVPIHLGTFNIVQAGSRIKLFGSYLLAYQGPLGQIAIIDTTAPAALTVVQTIDISPIATSDVGSVVAVGRYLYVGFTGGMLRTYEFTGRTSTQIGGDLDLDITGARIDGIVREGNYLYANVQSQPEIRQINITDASTPTLGLLITTSAAVSAMASQENILYCATASDILRFNLTNPTSIGDPIVALGKVNIGSNTSVPVANILGQSLFCVNDGFSDIPPNVSNIYMYDATGDTKVLQGQFSSAGGATINVVSGATSPLVDGMYIGLVLVILTVEYNIVSINEGGGSFNVSPGTVPAFAATTINLRDNHMRLIQRYRNANRCKAGFLLGNHFAAVRLSGELQLHEINGQAIDFLASGSIETGFLSTRSSAAISNDLNVGGTASIANGMFVGGDSVFGGDLVVADTSVVRACIETPCVRSSGIIRTVGPSGVTSTSFDGNGAGALGGGAVIITLTGGNLFNDANIGDRIVPSDNAANFTRIVAITDANTMTVTALPFSVVTSVTWSRVNDETLEVISSLGVPHLRVSNAGVTTIADLVTTGTTTTNDLTVTGTVTGLDNNDVGLGNVPNVDFEAALTTVDLKVTGTVTGIDNNDVGLGNVPNSNFQTSLATGAITCSTIGTTGTVAVTGDVTATGDVKATGDVTCDDLKAVGTVTAQYNLRANAFASSITETPLAGGTDPFVMAGVNTVVVPGADFLNDLRIGDRVYSTGFPVVNAVRVVSIQSATQFTFEPALGAGVNQFVAWVRISDETLEVISSVGVPHLRVSRAGVTTLAELATTGVATINGDLTVAPGTTTTVDTLIVTSATGITKAMVNLSNVPNSNFQVSLATGDITSSGDVTVSGDVDTSTLTARHIRANGPAAVTTPGIDGATAAPLSVDDTTIVVTGGDFINELRVGDRIFPASASSTESVRVTAITDANTVDVTALTVPVANGVLWNKVIDETLEVISNAGVPHLRVSQTGVTTIADLVVTGTSTVPGLAAEELKVSSIEHITFGSTIDMRSNVDTIRAVNSDLTPTTVSITDGTIEMGGTVSATDFVNQITGTSTQWDTGSNDFKLFAGDTLRRRDFPAITYTVLFDAAQTTVEITPAPVGWAASGTVLERYFGAVGELGTGIVGLGTLFDTTAPPGSLVREAGRPTQLFRVTFTISNTHLQVDPIYNNPNLPPANTARVPWVRDTSTVVLTGTIAGTINSSTLNGTDTLFLTELRIGDPISQLWSVDAGQSIVYRVSSITSDTVLTLTAVVSANSHPAELVQKVWKKVPASDNPFEVIDTLAISQFTVTRTGAVTALGALQAESVVSVAAMSSGGTLSSSGALTTNGHFSANRNSTLALTARGHRHIVDELRVVETAADTWETVEGGPLWTAAGTLVTYSGTGTLGEINVGDFVRAFGVTTDVSVVSVVNSPVSFILDIAFDDDFVATELERQIGSRPFSIFNNAGEEQAAWDRGGKLRSNEMKCDLMTVDQNMLVSTPYPTTQTPISGTWTTSVTPGFEAMLTAASDGKATEELYVGQLVSVPAGGTQYRVRAISDDDTIILNSTSSTAVGATVNRLIDITINVQQNTLAYPNRGTFSVDVYGTTRTPQVSTNSIVSLGREDILAITFDPTVGAEQITLQGSTVLSAGTNFTASTTSTVALPDGADFQFQTSMLKAFYDSEQGLGTISPTDVTASFGPLTLDLTPGTLTTTLNGTIGGAGKWGWEIDTSGVCTYTATATRSRYFRVSWTIGAYLSVAGVLYEFALVVDGTASDAHGFVVATADDFILTTVEDIILVAPGDTVEIQVRQVSAGEDVNISNMSIVGFMLPNVDVP